MKMILAALVAAPVLLVGTASAEQNMSSNHFVRANRCVTYASLPILQSNAVDIAAISQRVAAARSAQSGMTRLQVQSLKRDIRESARSADTQPEIEKLLERRDRYCRGFVDATQLAARTGTTIQQ